MEIQVFYYKKYQSFEDYKKRMIDIATVDRPVNKGSEKQVAWATEIKKTGVDHLLDLVEIDQHGEYTYIQRVGRRHLDESLQQIENWKKALHAYANIQDAKTLIENRGDGLMAKEFQKQLLATLG